MVLFDQSGQLNVIILHRQQKKHTALQLHWPNRGFTEWRYCNGLHLQSFLLSLSVFLFYFISGRSYWSENSEKCVIPVAMEAAVNPT